MRADYGIGFGLGKPAMNALYEHHMDSIRFGIGVLTAFC